MNHIVKCFGLVIMFAAMQTGASVYGQTLHTWTGAGDGSDWHDPFNWSASAVPLAGEPVLIDGDASVLLTNSTAALSAFTLTNATLTMAGWETALEADTVTVGDGGTITLLEPFAEGAMSNRIWIVCVDFELAAGGTLDADGLGYNRQQGPGKAANVGSTGGPGAGHGGCGGAGMGLPGGIAYGSIHEPQTPGSGSGKTTNRDGRPGGGVIRIEATGNVTLNGTVSASGIDGEYHGFGRHSGGSAGGSIWISCETLNANDGVVMATGGQGQEVVYGSYSASGAGAGGRIAIHYDTGLQTPASVTGLTLSTTPGPGNMNFVSAIAPTEPYVRVYGDAYFTISHEADWGSIYLSDAEGVISITETISGIGGHLSFGDGGPPATLNALTLNDAYLGFEDGATLTIDGDVTIAPGAGLIARSPLNLTVVGNWVNDGWTRAENGGTIVIAGNLSITNDARCFFADGVMLDVAGDLSVAGTHGKLVLRDMEAEIGGDLILTDNAWFAPLGGATNGAPDEAGLDLTVFGELRLDAGSWIYPYSHPQNGGSPRLTAGTLAIADGAGINANTRGFNATQGPGKGTGTSGLTTSAGAGYGGRGGDAASGRSGGIVYGSRWMPVDPGSGGGSTTSRTGGRGGGAIRLRIDRTAFLEGMLTANGANGGSYSGRDSGGGSGGAILLMAERLVTGSNTTFTALGGNAFGGGGAGGGGRIAIWYGLPTADRQSLLDKVDDFSEHYRLIEYETLGTFEGELSVLNGTGGYEDGDPGTMVFVRMMAPPGTVIMLR